MCFSKRSPWKLRVSCEKCLAKIQASREIIFLKRVRMANPTSHWHKTLDLVGNRRKVGLTSLR